MDLRIIEGKWNRFKFSWFKIKLKNRYNRLYKFESFRVLEPYLN